MQACASTGSASRAILWIVYEKNRSYCQQYTRTDLGSLAVGSPFKLTNTDTQSINARSSTLHVGTRIREIACMHATSGTSKKHRIECRYRWAWPGLASPCRSEKHPWIDSSTQDAVSQPLPHVAEAQTRFTLGNDFSPVPHSRQFAL